VNKKEKLRDEAIAFVCAGEYDEAIAVIEQLKMFPY